MKLISLKLSLLERSLMQRLLMNNLEACQRDCSHTDRQKYITRLYNQLSTLPQTRIRFFPPCYGYKWCLTPYEQRQLLKELNEGRNRDLRAGNSVDMINKIMLKLSEAQESKKRKGVYL